MTVPPLALLRHVLMMWLTLTFVFSWLPLVRALMDGTSYQWGTRYFELQFTGAGLTGDLWLLVAQTLLGVWLLYRGWRDPSPPFAAVLLLWFGLLAAHSVYSAATTPQQYRFEGATLGVNVSLAALAPLLHATAFVLAGWWVTRQRRVRASPGRPRWTTTNARIGSVVVLHFPVQFVLLRTGQGQETTDVVGVLLTIAQWLLISAALYPWRRRVPGEIPEASTA